MQKKIPLVSVIIPTFKRPDTLDRAIKTVLNQTYQNVEVIVVDDNNPESIGRSLTEIKMVEFEGNQRVKYVKHDKNKNGSAARNTGVSHSNAEYIAFLDDDDEFLPTKIENQVRRLEEMGEEYGICYTAYYSKKVNEEPILSTECREGNLFFEALTRELSFCSGSNMLVRKSAYDEINGFDEDFKRNQDKEFCTRILYKYKIAYVAEPGLIVNIHMNHGYFNPIDISQFYLDKFKSYINELPVDKKNEFYRIQARMNFNYYVSTNHDFISAIRMIVCGNVGIYDAMSVMISLVKKVISRSKL